MYHQERKVQECVSVFRPLSKLFPRRISTNTNLYPSAFMYFSFVVCRNQRIFLPLEFYVKSACFLKEFLNTWFHEFFRESEFLTFTHCVPFFFRLPIDFQKIWMRWILICQVTWKTSLINYSELWALLSLSHIHFPVLFSQLFLLRQGSFGYWIPIWKRRELCDDQRRLPWPMLMDIWVKRYLELQLFGLTRFKPRYRDPNLNRPFWKKIAFLRILLYKLSCFCWYDIFLWHSPVHEV